MLSKGGEDATLHSTWHSFESGVGLPRPKANMFSGFTLFGTFAEMHYRY